MPKNDEPGFGHIFGIGLQVAVGVGVGFIVGSWLDKKYGLAPWGTLVGCMLGLAGGLYLLIKEGMQANK